MKAQLFITCIIDTLYPDIGEAVINILEHVGVEVNVPAGQTCCGQPSYNAGLREQARRMAIHMIQTFEANPGPVVIPSGSCAMMIRHIYLDLFADDPEWLPRAQALAIRTYELTEFIVDVLGITDLGSDFSGSITYHPSCHLLRGLGVDRQPLQLLSSLHHAQITELPHREECCGFGGVFSVEHPEISAAMLDRKIGNIEASQAPVIVACDAGCITHINGGLHRQGKTQRALHIAQILDHL